MCKEYPGMRIPDDDLIDMATRCSNAGIGLKAEIVLRQRYPVSRALAAIKASRAGRKEEKGAREEMMSERNEGLEGLRAMLELFRCQLIDGQIIKESDGEPWPLSKSEANQIVAELEKRLTTLAASAPSSSLPAQGRDEHGDRISKLKG
jgi:hypothetical protein